MTWRPRLVDWGCRPTDAYAHGPRTDDSVARTPPARTAGQRPLIALVAVVVLAVAGSTLATDRARQDDPGAPAGPGAAPAPSPEPGREAEVVGPARGAEVGPYIEDRTAALLDAPATLDTAIVSFSEVLTVEEAQTIIAGRAEIRSVLLRLPLELATPQTVRVGSGDDLAAAVEEALQQRLEPVVTELDAQRELLDSDTVEDEAFVAEYERRIEELEAARAAAEAGEVVHAVVVRGGLADLQALVDAPAVRLVDPAPPGTDVALSVFHGLMPGDDDTVSFGRAP